MTRILFESVKAEVVWSSCFHDNVFIADLHVYRWTSFSLINVQTLKRNCFVLKLKQEVFVHRSAQVIFEKFLTVVIFSRLCKYMKY